MIPLVRLIYVKLNLTQIYRQIQVAYQKSGLMEVTSVLLSLLKFLQCENWLFLDPTNRAPRLS